MFPNSLKSSVEERLLGGQCSDVVTSFGRNSGSLHYLMVFYV